MTAAIAIRPTANPAHASDVRAVEVSGLDAAADLHDIEAGDANFSPIPSDVVNEVSADPVAYYLTIDGMADTKDLVSPVFSPSSEGKWTWDNVIFPEAGSMTIHLLKASDDSEITTQAVTVS